MKDKKTLVKNQYKILERVLKGHEFKQEELDDIYGRYDKKEYNTFIAFLSRDGSSEREKLLADIYYATEINNLERVNNFIDRKIGLENADKGLIKILTVLGIIE